MIVTLFVLVLGSLIGGLLLTPPVFSVLQLIIGEEMRWPFSRVFDRVAMVVAAGFIYAFRRRLSFSEVTDGFASGGWWDRFRIVLIGMIITVITSAAVLGLTVGDGKLQWVAAMRPDLLPKMFMMLPAALLISCIEEAFFRCLLLNRLTTIMPFGFAALLSSMLYAFVHFIAPVREFSYTQFEPLAGIRYMFTVLERMGSAGVAEAGLGLVLVGLLLCGVMRVTGSLLLCIGLHSGWVLALKFGRFTTEASPGYVFESGIGQRYFLVAEPLSWLSLVFVGMSVLFFRKYFLNTVNSGQRVGV